MRNDSTKGVITQNASIMSKGKKFWILDTIAQLYGTRWAKQPNEWGVYTTSTTYLASNCPHQPESKGTQYEKVP